VNKVIIEKLEADLLEANQELEQAIAVEVANDYSDAMESMERTYAEGFAEALEYALNIIKGDNN
jgi:hypothetical protein